MKPIFEKDSNESRDIKITTKPHFENKDAIELIIPDLVGHNKIERYFDGKLIDHTFVDGKGLGKDTILRWHVPKSLFPDNKKFKIKITQIPNDELLTDDTVS